MILQIYLAIQRPSHTDGTVNYTRAIYIKTALQVLDLVRLQASLNEYEHMMSSGAQAISLLLYILLNTTPNPKHNLAITSLCIYFKAQSQR